MKKFDIVLIVIFMVLSFIPQAIYTINNRRFNDEYIEIKVDGKVYKTIHFKNLSKDETVDININTEKGHNEILISKDGAKMIAADCRDQICIKEGLIDKPGESIVCLPHNVIVTVRGSNQEVDVIAK
ncbi:MAG: NusG domain II-containing protein [Oscillospiraceae bacterium]|nr:NusG domain II-containing protein [Oscillospiraceae bacterium]